MWLACVCVCVIHLLSLLLLGGRLQTTCTAHPFAGLPVMEYIFWIELTKTPYDSQSCVIWCEITRCERFTVYLFSLKKWAWLNQPFDKGSKAFVCLSKIIPFEVWTVDDRIFSVIYIGPKVTCLLFVRVFNSHCNYTGRLIGDPIDQSRYQFIHGEREWIAHEEEY